MTQSAVSCTCTSLIIFKFRTTLVPCSLAASISGPKSQGTSVRKTLEILMGCNQLGTNSLQSSPDLLRWVFVSIRSGEHQSLRLETRLKWGLHMVVPSTVPLTVYQSPTPHAFKNKSKDCNKNRWRPELAIVPRKCSCVLHIILWNLNNSIDRLYLENTGIVVFFDHICLKPTFVLFHFQVPLSKWR